MLKRLFVPMLLFIQASKANPAPPSGGLFSGITSAAVGTFNKIVFNKVDLANVFNPVFEDIQKHIGVESCIAGVHKNVNNNAQVLTLVNGHMSEFHYMYTDTNSLHEDENTITAQVQISFPSLPIKYDFTYSTQRFLTSVNREGFVQIKQNGPVTLEFEVDLPKSQKEVDQRLKSTPKKCVATVKSVKTIVNKKLSTVKVDYDSMGQMFGMKMTEGEVRSMIEGLSEDIRDNIAAAIKLLIEPAFRGHSFNCNDAQYTVPIGAAGLEALDCNHVVEATKYKPQP